MEAFTSRTFNRHEWFFPLSISRQAIAMNSTTRLGWSDFLVLWHLLAKRVSGQSHTERLESFYGGQARDYDSSRSRLLHGRQVMIDAIDVPEGGVWVDIGAGTGENAERLAHRRTKLKSLYRNLSPFSDNRNF